MPQKKIVLGVSSSIACYKSCELVRLLQKNGCTVHVVMTSNATHLVTPLTFETLSGNPVHSDTFGARESDIHHVSLARDAHLFLVAPATANVIAKMACGIADDLLSTTFLTMRCPVLVAPAMHPSMWQNPAVLANVAALRRAGVHFAEPDFGAVASGDEGQGRMAGAETILSVALSLFS